MSHFSWPDVIQLCWFDRGKLQRTYKLGYMGSGTCYIILCYTIQILCAASSSNPVFDLAMSGMVTTVHSYCTRYEAAGTMITKCVRQKDFQYFYL